MSPPPRSPTPLPSFHFPNNALLGCTLKGSNGRVCCPTPHYTHVFLLYLSLPPRSDRSPELSITHHPTQSNLIDVQRRDMQKDTASWSEAEMGRGLCRKKNRPKNKRIRRRAERIMSVPVTHSLPSLCPLLRGVSHFREEETNERRLSVCVLKHSL